MVLHLLHMRRNVTQGLFNTWENVSMTALLVYMCPPDKSEIRLKNS